MHKLQVSSTVTVHVRVARGFNTGGLRAEEGGGGLGIHPPCRVYAQPLRRLSSGVSLASSSNWPTSVRGPVVLLDRGQVVDRVLCVSVGPCCTCLVLVGLLEAVFGAGGLASPGPALGAQAALLFSCLSSGCSCELSCRHPFSPLRCSFFFFRVTAFHVEAFDGSSQTDSFSDKCSLT